jgi:hypothetical protein
MVKLYLCLSGGFTQFPTHVKLCPKVSPWWNSFLLSPKGFMQKVKFCWCGAVFNVHETLMKPPLRLALSNPMAIWIPADGVRSRRRTVEHIEVKEGSSQIKSGTTKWQSKLVSVQISLYICPIWLLYVCAFDIYGLFCLCFFPRENGPLFFYFGLVLNRVQCDGDIGVTCTTTEPVGKR